jgi:D-psicose/D-tagatose/L-ribulose 3-epimerase
MTYVHEVNHPNIQCLLDTWHLWYENEPLEHVRVAMPWIKHVHLADLEGRVAPGESGKSDYRPVFRVLKECHYGGTISVEALKFDDYTGVGARVLKFVKRQWDEA